MRKWLGVVTALVALAASSACVPKVSQPQTDIMAKTGKVSVSAAVLRVRMNDLTDRFAGRIEQTADRIGLQTTDEAIRLRALRLKVDAIPAVYTAGYRADPLVATLDLWTFAYQFSQYAEKGPGRDAFGPQQPLIQATGQALVADADATIKAIAILPEHFDQSRARVEGWATAHPVEHAFSSRASGGSLVAEFQSETQDAFAAVGQVSDVLENVSERLNTYATQMPKQARWQAEILVTEMTGPRGGERVLADLHDISAAAKRATDVLDDVPGTLGTSGLLEAGGAMLAGERRAVLAGVDDQRVQTLAFITAESRALRAAASDERMGFVASLRDERKAALANIDALSTRTVESTMAGLRDLVDYALWRVAALLGALMLLAAMLGVIAFRLTVGRRAA